MLKCRPFAVGLLILWWASIVYAADMNFEVNTGIGYDSNVLRSASSPEDDVYFTLSPEAALTLAFHKMAFSLSSRAAWERYVNRTDANLQELIFSGLGRYSSSAHTSFRLQDELIVSDRLRSAEKLTDVVGPREFMENRFSSDFKRKLKAGVLEVSLEYANIIRNYRHTEKDDWIAHTGRFRVEYFFGYKTSTQLSFGLTRKMYELDVDYTSVPVTASLKRKLSNDLYASFSLGLQNRRYSEPYKNRNWDEPNVSLAIIGEFTPKTTSRLGLQRKVYDSDAAIGDAFVSKAGDIALFLNLSNAARLILQGIYSRNDYIQFKRTDSFMEGRGEIRYRLLKRGAVALSYGYGRRDSNIPFFDYQQHAIGLSYVVIF